MECVKYRQILSICQIPPSAALVQMLEGEGGRDWLSILSTTIEGKSEWRKEGRTRFRVCSPFSFKYYKNTHCILQTSYRFLANCLSFSNVVFKAGALPKLLGWKRLYLDWLNHFFRVCQTKGASINDVHKSLGFFYLLPPLCPQNTYCFSANLGHFLTPPPHSARTFYMEATLGDLAEKTH